MDPAHCSVRRDKYTISAYFCWQRDLHRLTASQWLFSLVFIVPAFRYFERLWGAVELVKFVLITGVVSNVIAVAVAWIEALVLPISDLVLCVRAHSTYLSPYVLHSYQQNYFGMTAVQTGVLVAFTQLIPEHQVQLLGVVRIRVKVRCAGFSATPPDHSYAQRLPMIYVTISTVLCLVGYQAPWILIQFGWLVSWTYLRFYKKSGSESGAGDTYGDRSETFAFVHWFPPFLQYAATSGLVAAR